MLMLLVWYPGEYFRIAGGSALIVILVGVDIVLGPLLTLVVFNPMKRLLKLDLALIATVQLAALCYGTWVMFEARPAWLVFVVDRFEVISTIDVSAADRAAAKRPEFRSINLGRPLLAAAAMPTDSKERNAVVAAAMDGVDALLLPRHWVPWAEARERALSRALTLDAMRAVDPAVNGPVFDAALAELGRPADTGAGGQGEARRGRDAAGRDQWRAGADGPRGLVMLALRRQRLPARVGMMCARPSLQRMEGAAYNRQCTDARRQGAAHGIG